MSATDSKWSVWEVCWKQRRLYFITGILALIGASIISLSIPPVYHAFKQISVDATKDDILEKGERGLLVEKQTGLNPSTVTTDPELYALILRSPLFLSNMERISLKTFDGKKRETYTQHLVAAQKPWWNFLLREKSPIELIQQNVKCEVNMHNGLLTIRVADQDPFVAFQMVDTVSYYLQEELYKYIRFKAEIDLKNRKKDMMAAKENYRQAQDKYNSYSEHHFDITTPSGSIELKDLEKAADLSLQEYNEAIQQYNITKINYDKTRPNFIDFTSNAIPLNPSRPHWIANFFIWLFYSWIGTTWFILYRKKHQLKTLCPDGKQS